MTSEHHLRLVRLLWSFVGFPPRFWWWQRRVCFADFRWLDVARQQGQTCVGLSAQGAFDWTTWVWPGWNATFCSWSPFWRRSWFTSESCCYVIDLRIRERSSMRVECCLYGIVLIRFVFCSPRSPTQWVPGSHRQIPRKLQIQFIQPIFATKRVDADVMAVKSDGISDFGGTCTEL